MANAKQIKEICQEFNLTKQDFQKMWDELLELDHFIVKILNKNIGNWDKQNTSIIRQLPTAKENLLRFRAEKAREEQEAKEKALKEAQEKEYYNTHFEEIMIQKIRKQEPLSEAEIKTLIWDYGEQDINGPEHRWQKEITTICKLPTVNAYVAITWYQGLTECQENDYSNLPIEVKPRSREVAIVHKYLDWYDDNNKLQASYEIETSSEIRTPVEDTLNEV